MLKLKCSVMLVIISIVILIPVKAYSCSYARWLPSTYDQEDYIFWGEIVGYCNLENQNVGGLILNLNGRISSNIPKVIKVIELYPFTTESDCSPKGLALDEVKKYYPQKSIIRVVAKKSKLLPDSSNKILRLESSGFNGGSISIIYSNQPAPDINFKMDYKKYGEDVDLALKLFDINKVDITGFLSWGSILEYEVRKDLYRLETTKSEKQRYKILKRLKDCPGIFSYKDMVLNYLQDDKKIRTLIKGDYVRLKDLLPAIKN